MTVIPWGVSHARGVNWAAGGSMFTISKHSWTLYQFSCGTSWGILCSGLPSSGMFRNPLPVWKFKVKLERYQQHPALYSECLKLRLCWQPPHPSEEARGVSQGASFVPPPPEWSSISIGPLKWSESGHVTPQANWTYCEESFTEKTFKMLNWLDYFKW